MVTCKLNFFTLAKNTCRLLYWSCWIVEFHLGRLDNSGWVSKLLTIQIEVNDVPYELKAIGDEYVWGVCINVGGRGLQLPHVGLELVSLGLIFWKNNRKFGQKITAPPKSKILLHP